MNLYSANAYAFLSEANSCTRKDFGTPVDQAPSLKNVVKKSEKYFCHFSVYFIL